MGPIVGYALQKFIESLTAGDTAKAAAQAIADRVQAFKDNSMRAVKEVDISFVQPLKDKGEFTPEAVEQAKSLAIDKLKSYYGTQGVVDLAMFFDTNAEGLNKLLDAMIEAAIYDNKFGHSKAGSLSLSDSEQPGAAQEAKRI